MDAKSLAMKNAKKYWYVIVLLAIFLSAFWIRSFPARFNELQAIDPFYMYRMSEYVVTHDFQLPDVDMMRHYPFGIETGKDLLVPFYLPALMYTFIGPLSGLDYFHYALLYPALMGAIATIVIYFLGKEMFDRKTGLFAAFFLAMMPAFITRTSAGFFDREASVCILIPLTCYFLVRAFKRNSWKSGILSGISMLVLTQTWEGGMLYIQLMISLFVFIALLLNRDIERVSKAFIPFTLITVFGMQLLPFSISVLKLTNIVQLVILGILLVRIAAERYNLIKQEQMIYLIPAIIVLGLVGLFVSSIFTDAGMGYVTNAMTIATLQKGVVFSTVAEANPGDWNSITGATSVSYGGQVIPQLSSISFLLSMNLFMLMGIALLAYRFYRRWDFITLFTFIWLVSALWSVFGFIRLLFLIGPPVALVSAYFITRLINIGKRTKVMREADTIRKKINYVSVPITVFIALMVVANFSNAYVYGMSMGPSFNQYWKESMNFLATETPENSNILSWWDFGYWFQTRGQRPTLTDGGFGERHTVSYWFTAHYQNWTDYEPWLKDKYGVDYILMDYTLPAKYGAISKISSAGEQVVGIMQFQQSQIYPQDNRTIFEFKSGPYAIWLPMDDGGNVIVGAPMLLVSQNDQYYSKAYINDICTTDGITTVGQEQESIGGCVALTSFGVFYVPPEAEYTIFSNLMFMEGNGLPVEKVFDNQAIKIYKVLY